MTTGAGERLDRSGRRLVWAGLLVAPAAWLLNLELAYLLVSAACSGRTTFPLHVVSFVALIIAAGGGVLAWRSWSRLGREWPGDDGGWRAAGRLVAVLGAMLSALIILVIVAQWIPVLFLDPCAEA